MKGKKGNEGSAMISETKEFSALIDKWGIPFARALAEFVRAASAQNANDNRKITGGTPQSNAVKSTPSAEFLVEELDPREYPAAYEHLRKLHAEYRSGKTRSVLFNPAVPAKTMGSRLKQIFKSRGIKQSEIARKLGVAPSVISRVFKHPERSRIQTIRNIADAAGIPLRELV